MPRLPALLLAAALAIPAAQACDLEELSIHLTAVCDAALKPAADALTEVLPHATPQERAFADRHLAAAREACASGDPEAGARTATLLARLAGRIEARVGINTPLVLAAR